MRFVGRKKNLEMFKRGTDTQTGNERDRETDRQRGGKGMVGGGGGGGGSSVFVHVPS